MKYMHTSNLALTTTLVLLKCKILDIDRSDLKRIVFFFEDTPETQNLKEAFYDNSLRVSPIEFMHELHKVKALVYGEQLCQ